MPVEQCAAPLFEQWKNFQPNQCLSCKSGEMSTGLPTDFVRNFCSLLQQRLRWAGIGTRFYIHFPAGSHIA
jgi:hypothetical protein